jgi:hypothetical protein
MAGEQADAAGWEAVVQGVVVIEILISMSAFGLIWH